MRRDSDLPVFAQGAGRLKLALQASLSPSSLRCKHPGALLDTLQHWNDGYLNKTAPAWVPAKPSRTGLCQFVGGYCRG